MGDRVQELVEAVVAVRAPAQSTILIVDDEPNVIEIISYFLKEQGYQIISAENGGDALSMVESHYPDVIILDVVMPDLSGIEVCRRLKSEDGTRYLPVILVTAREDTTSRIRGKEAGADDFLDKPVNELELLTRVQSLLRTKMLFEQVEASNRELESRVQERTSELRAASLKLAELDRAKSNIIANISHELRSPLQQIKSAVSLLTGEDLPQRQADVVQDTVDSAVDTLVNLVEDMIALGQATEFHIERIMLSHVIHQAITQASLAHRNRSADIVSEVEESLPPVEGDARALTRVLFHLIDNAIKFSSDGTVVVIRAGRVEDGRVRLSVEDRGTGISEDSREHIFDLFFQADDSATRRHSGAGIGLALVKLVLDGHGLDVYVEGEEGAGSIFWFDLDGANID